ncbi:BrnT family toxin [Methylomonas koyamae]|uniref:BrnT family toxin n=1 Tax=Methylomonas koyamae TaxID=702114 RepID=UPI002873896C|nr:BrnT family toxin [Methylomonas koyamae]WNB78043.1 BrnT family toxin [Methylomonas koyamae]
MQITFDPEKDRINQQKHGLSLADAEKLEWSELFFWPDDRIDYGEPRFIGYAPIGQRLYCVVYVDRGDVRRIISLRKANPREVKLYAANN